MQSEVMAAALEVVSAAHFYPIWLLETFELTRNAALIAIPFVLWGASRAVERRRATLDLIRSIDREISTQLERLYIFRKYEEGTVAHLSLTPQNPYEESPTLFFFDSVIVLNFYEAVCTEIEESALDDDLLYKTCRNSIIGVTDVILQRYNKKVGTDQSENYEMLLAVTKRWKQRAEPSGELGATSIPGD